MGQVIQSAYIEITSRCNMRCRHCYNESEHGNNHYMQTVDFLKIIKKLRSFGCDDIIISGGEPLLHCDINRFLILVKEIGFNGLTVISNGIVYNQGIADVFKSTYTTLVISMDGPDLETYSVFRDSSCFETVKNNVVRYAKVCDVQLNMLLNRYNCSSIEKMVEFASGHRINVLNLLNLNYIGRARNFFDLYALTTDELTQCRDAIRIIQKKYPTVSIINSVNPLLTSTCRYLTHNQDFAYHVRVDSKGNLYPCSSAVNALGNLLTGQIDSVFKQLTETASIEMRKKVALLYKNCCECEARSICMKGCPLLFSSYEQLSRYCEDCKSEFRRVQRIKDWCASRSMK